MAIELTMPALSPTMEKGTLARWLVEEGALVKAGDLLAEIETDKATMEFEATDPGYITRLLVAAGTEDVPVGTVIALLGAEAVTPAPTTEAKAESAAAPIEVVREPEMAAAPTVVETAPPSPLAPKTSLPSGASPLAGRIAQAKGLALGGISGTGAGGRILLGDLGVRTPLPVVEVRLPVAAVPMPLAVGAPPPGAQATKLSSMRRTIARRLTESKTSIPHFYLSVRCNLDPLLAFRRDMNGSLPADGARLSVNDMLIKALALALREVPDAHVQYGGDSLYRFDQVDVSMAVAVDGGLLTPVLRNADGLSLSAVSRATRALAVKAREGKLLPQDYEGGTVSISNLGMFGIDSMVPVINPPQALILGVAAGIEQPWKVDNAIGLATVMEATASFDHRAIDGAIGADFLQTFRLLVESPLRLAV